MGDLSDAEAIDQQAKQIDIIIALWIAQLIACQLKSRFSMQINQGLLDFGSDTLSSEVNHRTTIDVLPSGPGRA